MLERNRNSNRNEYECCSSTKDLRLLREKGQVIDLPEGGSHIISSPELMPFRIPSFQLRVTPINSWQDMDKVWLNV